MASRRPTVARYIYIATVGLDKSDSYAQITYTPERSSSPCRKSMDCNNTEVTLLALKKQ